MKKPNPKDTRHHLRLRLPLCFDDLRKSARAAAAPRPPPPPRLGSGMEG